MLKKQLYIEYAKDERKFKIGDIIKNNSVTIVVEKFGVSVGGMPQPTYEGKELGKDLSYKKNGHVARIYGNDGIKLLRASK